MSCNPKRTVGQEPATGVGGYSGVKVGYTLNPATRLSAASRKAGTAVALLSRMTTRYSGRLHFPLKLFKATDQVPTPPPPAASLGSLVAPYRPAPIPARAKQLDDLLDTHRWIAHGPPVDRAARTVSMNLEPDALGRAITLPD